MAQPARPARPPPHLKRRLAFQRTPNKAAQLAVFAHLGGDFVPCAQLRLQEQGIETLASELAYGTRYAARADAVDIDPVSAPLARARAAPGQFFTPAAGLQLFGGIRDAAPDAWGRRVIEARLKVPANALPESVYLLEAGSDRVGALDVRDNLNAAPRPGHAQFGDLAHLLDAADRLEQGLELPEHLLALLGTSAGLGGARPKASVRDQEGRLWLAKFSTQADRFDIPAVEAAALRLASQAGMRVPTARRILVGGRSVMLIERFDRWRPEDGGPEHRHAFISALTLTGAHPSDAQNQSYPLLADAMRRHVSADHVKTDLRELFKRMVFNILVHNTDDHLRNHGFIHVDGGWRLSPLYDVLPMPSVAHERLLHLGVGARGREATIANAASQAERFGLGRTQAQEAVDEVWRVVREWRTWFEGWFDEWGVGARTCDDVASAFLHIDRLGGRGARSGGPSKSR